MSVKISALPAAGALSGTEEVPVVQSGATSKTTTQDIANLGVGLSSYQNSAMSTAVNAYVFKDSGGNIYRVYEPIRNNDVSRSVFAYADSIDLVPFDNADWYDNRLLDVKLINLQGKSIFNGCDLQTMIVDASGAGTNPITFSSIDTGTKTVTINASFGDLTTFFNQLISADAPIHIYGSTSNDAKYTLASTNFDSTNTTITVNEVIPSSTADGGISGFLLSNHVHKGEFGEGTTNSKEIYATGDNVYLTDNGVGCASYFDSIGDFTVFSKCDLMGYVDLDFNDNGIVASKVNFETASGFSVNTTSVLLSGGSVGSAAFLDLSGHSENCHFGDACYANIINNVGNSYFGVNSSIDTTNGTIRNSTIGDNTTYNSPSDQNHINVIQINGTTYTLSVVAGVVNAT